MVRLWIFFLSLIFGAATAYGLDVNGQLKNAQLEKLSADPVTNAVEGRIFYDTDDDVARYYTGAAWRTIAETSTALSNPMDSTGDLIYGGASGVATKLDSGTSGQALFSGGAGAPVWTGLADGKLWMGNASNLPIAVTPSGDITWSNAGVTAIGSGVIVNADINSAAAIDGSKLVAASGSVAGAVTTGTQTFAGAKTFSDVTAVGGSTNAVQLTVNANASQSANIVEVKQSDGSSNAFAVTDDGRFSGTLYAVGKSSIRGTGFRTSSTADDTGATFTLPEGAASSWMEISMGTGSTNGEQNFFGFCRGGSWIRSVLTGTDIEVSAADDCTLAGTTDGKVKFCCANTSTLKVFNRDGGNVSFSVHVRYR